MNEDKDQPSDSPAVPERENRLHRRAQRAEAEAKKAREFREWLENHIEACRELGLAGSDGNVCIVESVILPRLREHIAAAPTPTDGENHG